MEKNVLGGFVFWQERSHILRTWQEETSTLETSGNIFPTAAGRPTSAKLALQPADFEVDGVWWPMFLKSTSSGLTLRDCVRCDWVEFPTK